MTIGGRNVTGPRSATICSGDSHAKLHIISEGNSDATLRIETASGGQPSIILAERESATTPRVIQLMNDGIDDRFVISDGMNEFMDIKSDTGFTRLMGETLLSSGATVLQDMTIGGYNISGPRKLVIESSDSMAEMNIIGGRTSNAELNIRAPQDQDAILTLSEEEHQFDLLRDGVTNRFVVRSSGSTDQLLSVAPTTGNLLLRGELKIGHDEDVPMFLVNQFTGDTAMQGDLTVGGHDVPGPRAATIQSRDDTATLSVISGQNSNAEIYISAPDSADAIMTFNEGIDSFHMLNDGSTKKFTISDGTNDLLTLSKGDGNTYLRGSLKVGHDEANPMFVVESLNGDTSMRGDMVVGGPHISGPRAMTIRSHDDTAALHIIAGASMNSELSVQAADDHDAIITLAEGNKRFHILNDGSADKLLVCAPFDIC